MIVPHKYTEEQKKFIKENAEGRYTDELTELFNEKFGTNLKESQIKAFKSNNGIRSDVPTGLRKGESRLFTKEQVKFIKQNVKGISNKELVDLVNKTFNLSVTEKQMASFKKNNGLVNGRDGRFKKGQEPWNKGMKGLDCAGENGKKTQFKKGQTPLNYRPVGSERVNVEGYIEIKVADPNEWKLKHRVVWEQANGPIPENHNIIFGDGNRLNCDIDNLILVSKKQMLALNQHKLIKNDVELTKAGVMIANLHIKMNELKKVAK